MKQRDGVHHTFCRASEEQIETIFRQTGKKRALIIKSPGVCSSDLQFRDVRLTQMPGTTGSVCVEYTHWQISVSTYERGLIPEFMRFFPAYAIMLQFWSVPLKGKKKKISTGWLAPCSAKAATVCEAWPSCICVNISYICTSILFYSSSNSIEIREWTLEISVSQDTSPSCYWFFWQHYVKALWKGGLNSIQSYSIQYVFIDACVGTSKQAGAHHPRPQINLLYKSPLWKKDNTKLNQPQLRLKIQRSKRSRRGSDLSNSQYFTPLWLKLCACL